MRHLPGSTFQVNMNMSKPALNIVRFQIIFQFQILIEYNYYNNTIIVK